MGGLAETASIRMDAASTTTAVDLENAALF